MDTAKPPNDTREGRHVWPGQCRGGVPGKQYNEIIPFMRLKILFSSLSLYVISFCHRTTPLSPTHDPIRLNTQQATTYRFASFSLAKTMKRLAYYPCHRSLMYGYGKSWPSETKQEPSAL